MPRIDPAQVQRLHAETAGRLDDNASAESDRVLRDLQQIMFAYDIGILEQADRLEDARDKVLVLAEKTKELKTDRIMLSGSPGMLAGLHEMFEARGLAEGSGNEPGHFVIEKAFLER